MNSLNGFSALGVLVLILLVSTLSLSFGFLYYVVNLEITDQLIQKFWIITGGFGIISGIPVGFYILILWARNRFNTDRTENNAVVIGQIASPTEKLVGDPLPPSPQITENKGGYEVGDIKNNRVGEDELIRSDVKKAIFSYIRMSNGLKFQDNNAISRIKAGMIRDATKDEIQQALFLLEEQGELIAKDAVLYINNENYARKEAISSKKEDIIQPISEVSTVDIEEKKLSIMDAQRLNAIFRMLKEIYPEKEEFEFQLNLILESKKPHQYPQILKELDSYRRENQKIAQEEADREERLIREKIQKSMEIESNEVGHPGTLQHNVGTPVGQ